MIKKLAIINAVTMIILFPLKFSNVVIVLYTFRLVLLLSGDIEPNPGPDGK